MRSDLLFSSESVRIADVECRAERSGCGPVEWCQSARIVIPRRGVFVVHRDEPVVADVNSVLVFGTDEERRISHPVDGGDRVTVLHFSPEIMEEAMGNSGRHGTLHPTTQAAVHLVTSALAQGRADELEGDEAALSLLARLARDVHATKPLRATRRGAAIQRRRIEQVREMIAARPAVRWRLDKIARAVNSSPYHLAREFRAFTGVSIGSHLRRLRIGLALHRLSEGESNLARIGTELGFAHHSHFSATFRATLGITPNAMRARLRVRRS
jgi:AraC-like DNA-binding protein